MIENTEVKEVTTLALSIPDQAKQIVIRTMDDYVRAGEIMLTIKAIRKKITDTFKPIKQKMDAAKQEVLDQERAADAPLKEAEALLKDARDIDKNPENIVPSYSPSPHKPQLKAINGTSRFVYLYFLRKSI